MASVKWSPLGTTVTYLSTELNSLANGARVIGAAITNSNSAARDRWADVELVVTFGTAPGAGAFCSLYIIPSLDGTSYSDGDASVQPPETMLVGIFPVRAVTTAQRVQLRSVGLPPTDFKFLIKNEAGQAFAASGNTLKYRTYNEEIV